ncbi:glycogen/starch/alpha-glucan phosphorylase [Desulfofalx alkaliphila]|uniref:glycogen/starch/alpha-glucan phosphorylase n=1 Tax=Desulfofalx alkaliphila TaxID=105483 RepID=UPI0004E111F3|nr:glycogen/starch/alpha-glucan phosphorylase [Desulfofalx alkaliphila]
MFSNKENFKRSFLEKLQTMYAISLEESSDSERYMVLGSLVRDYVSKNWVKTNKHYLQDGVKQVYYFSLEFLLGRMLESYLINLDIKDMCKEALDELGIDYNNIIGQEPDPGLGNGGLGRLGACFLDSLASLNLPGHGCGIRYRYGLFEQKIVNGYQVELPDNWLKKGNVWEVKKAEKAVEVRFGGDVKIGTVNGKMTFIHENYHSVMAVPYDTPIVGYKNNTVNTLRLWSAEVAQKDFDFQAFSKGDYLKAVEYKYSMEAISQVLYPDDSYVQGRLLRLKQQYFFVSAGIQSIVRRYKKKHGSLENFADNISIHINDTHPVLAIPELMRILMDEEGLGWDDAWQVTTNTVSYTNHTTLSEALEKWPVDMFKGLLPRIYMIVEEINKRFCQEMINKYPKHSQPIDKVAIIHDGHIRMANLALVGSYSVNGVSRIHTELLKKHVLGVFYSIYPYKFNNKTNGVTHRRFLIKANPKLAELISDTIGSSWIYHPSDLIVLRNYANDKSFQEEILKIKQDNKKKLAMLIRRQNGIDVDISSIFDVHVKRLHAYKRQVLNVMHIMDLYNRLKDNPNWDITPRTFIFGAKAAPAYHLAKETIKLINSVADVINNDKTINDKIKVVFIENYNVSLAESIIPAADVSEQISTASKEASGTGNMKFMMNGALTIGTLDGANVEIKEEVGENNIVIFGLNALEVQNYYYHGGYKAMDIYNSDERVKRVIDQMVNGFLLTPQEEFKALHNHLLYHDEYFVLKDFSSYVEAQCKVDNTYKQREKWLETSIINIAHSGKFSSDRTIGEYATGIWKVSPVVID